KEQVLDVEPKAVPEKKVTEVKTKEVNLFELEEESVEYQSEPKDPNRYILTIEMVKKNQIDPMIGMENVTPYN
ncbi:hypothetical protein, partial [Carnobacterium sp.]|uniref:hypothetical protein n=1 Tax=Carnobacterium sp. TaxID=48221 RepID=UPI002FC797A5